MLKKTHHFVFWLGALLVLACAHAYAQNPPDWMEGVFEGIDHDHNQTIVVRINHSGHLTITKQQRGKSIVRTRAEYRRGNLWIDGVQHRVEKTRTGFRMQRYDRHDSWFDLRRISDYNENWQNNDHNGHEDERDGDQRPPDWMDGVFEGINRKYNQTIIIRMTRSGHLIVSNQEHGKSVLRNRAEYRRGRLIIDGNEYRVEKTGNGFRTIQVDDRENRVDFRRTGSAGD